MLLIEQIVYHCTSLKNCTNCSSEHYTNMYSRKFLFGDFFQTLPSNSPARASVSSRLAKHSRTTRASYPPE